MPGKAGCQAPAARLSAAFRTRMLPISFCVYIHFRTKQEHTQAAMFTQVRRMIALFVDKPPG
jgi:hypothetical protein